MFGATVKLIAMPQKLKTAVDKGAYKSLRHAAFSIRKSAIESMVYEEGPSRPGTPPHAHTGRLGRSILVAQDKSKDEVTVGPSYSRVKVGGRPPWLAHMLEFGGVYGRPRRRVKRGRPRKDEKPEWQNKLAWVAIYPPRPFMQPALERSLARFHRDWQGII